jgi:transcription elongation GreA/GreB family factor
MSRAFVKEDDGAPPPIPERPISAAPNLVTPRGAHLIRQAIVELQARLARAAGDEETESIRRDLRYWSSRQASMRIVASVAAPEVVGLGTRVTIRRGSVDSVVTIVGEDESDPPNGRIAWTAPLARALAGAAAGDVVELATAGGREPIVVVALSGSRDEF